MYLPQNNYTRENHHLLYCHRAENKIVINPYELNMHCSLISHNTRIKLWVNLSSRANCMTVMTDTAVRRQNLIHKNKLTAQRKGDPGSTFENLFIFCFTYNCLIWGRVGRKIANCRLVLMVESWPGIMAADEGNIPAKVSLNHFIIFAVSPWKLPKSLSL